MRSSIRNGLPTLVQTLGRPRALELAKLAARLTGLQQYRHLAGAVGAVDGGPRDAAAFLAAMFAGLGDDCRLDDSAAGVRLHHRGLRLLRGLADEDRADLLACWTELWRGTLHAHRAFMDLRVQASDDGLCWIIEEGRDNDGVDA